MNSVKDLAVVIGLHGRPRKAEGLRVDVSVDNARKAYGRIDDLVTTLGRGRTTWAPAAASSWRATHERGSGLEALQLQLLERWSSLLLHTFASMMAERATSEPVQSEFLAFYVALAKLHGHVRGLRAESDPRTHDVHT